MFLTVKTSVFKAEKDRDLCKLYNYFAKNCAKDKFSKIWFILLADF